MTVYDYVVIYHPTKKQREKESQKPELVADGRLLAKDNNGALMLLSRELDDKWMEHPERLEIKIRPFDGGAEAAPEAQKTPEYEDSDEQICCSRSAGDPVPLDYANRRFTLDNISVPTSAGTDWSIGNSSYVTWGAPSQQALSFSGKDLVNVAE